jgi:protein-disulfide isomerase
VATRLLIALAILVVAVAIAWLLQRRSHGAPVRAGFTVPAQLDRDDFDRADAPWLVAVFTSATCDSCKTTWERARMNRNDTVAVVQVERSADRPLHDRYGIDAVPTIVIADADGVVRGSFLGPPSTDELTTTLATLTAL